MEIQLRLMGVLEPEIFDLSHQAPIQCIDWLDEIDKENIEIEKSNKADRELERLKFRMKVLMITFWSLFAVVYFLLFFYI